MWTPSQSINHAQILSITNKKFGNRIWTKSQLLNVIASYTSIYTYYTKPKYTTQPWKSRSPSPAITDITTTRKPISLDNPKHHHITTCRRRRTVHRRAIDKSYVRYITYFWFELLLSGHRGSHHWNHQVHHDEQPEPSLNQTSYHCSQTSSSNWNLDLQHSYNKTSSPSSPQIANPNIFGEFPRSMLDSIDPDGSWKW